MQGVYMYLYRSGNSFNCTLGPRLTRWLRS